MICFRGTHFLISIGLLFSATLTFAEDYYGDNECDYQYDSSDYDAEKEDLDLGCLNYHGQSGPQGPKCQPCHHQYFPNKTIQQELGDVNVQACCSGHGYIFNDVCKWANRTDTHGQMACGYPDNSVRGYEIASTCGLGCKEWHHSHLHYNPEYKNPYNKSVKAFDFNLPEDLEVQKGSKSVCASYECYLGWEVGFEACICPKKFENKERVSKETAKELPLCCTSGVTIQQVDDPTKLYCPQDKAEGSKICSKGNWEKTRWDKLSNETIHHGNEYCFGYSWYNHHVDWYKGLQLNRFDCKEDPCSGNCIRFCERKPSTNEEKMLKKSFGETIIFDQAPPQLCPEGQVLADFSANNTCKEKFELDDVNGTIRMKRSYDNTLLNSDQFCLTEYHGRGRIENGARICVDNPKTVQEKSGDKHKFYPYLMMTSCLFLLATIFVFTAIPNLRPVKNGMEYTKLMLHFTFAMLMAFICQSAVLLSTGLDDDNPGFCEFLGFATQFFFLTAFSFMTMMSIEPYMQISRGSKSNPRRYLKEVICGYSVPTIFLIMTGIAEASLDQCSKYRPRFNEEYCFFSDIESRGVWFFFPIGTALLVNTVMFALTVKSVCALDKEAKDLGITTGQKDKRMDRFLTFLKLFLGMGILWIFQIIGALLESHTNEESWYVPDIVNMSQGVIIFSVFVVNSTVFREIYKKFGGKSKNKNIIPLSKTANRARKVPFGPAVSTNVNETMTNSTVIH